jgi:hypothetical protein
VHVGITRNRLLIPVLILVILLITGTTPTSEDYPYK